MRTIKLGGFLPLMVIFMIIVCFMVYLLLERTRFGRRIVAIGGNEKNAYLSGINVDLYKVVTYGISGAIVSIAGLIFAARLNAITANAGSGYELNALVAAVIGGVTFEGGRGTVLGAFLGCVLIGIISSALGILGVDAYIKIVITGLIIVWRWCSATLESDPAQVRREGTSMKTGVSFFSFAQRWTSARPRSQAKKAGYDGIEPVLTDAGSLSMASTDRDLAENPPHRGGPGLEIPP
jgi:ABC-type uncharacterized transport system permease subunit